MADLETGILSGRILEEDTEVTFAELCEACAVQAEAVEAMIEEGIVSPTGGSQSRWRFSRSSVVRVRTVVRMQRDLQVNLAGAALALDLLERIDQLSARLRSLEPDSQS
ncbi:MAG: MerR family transcriptional regulator [Gammaproteobacteria bacterium]|nr:MerR family transcriptional regulator [Gammaproteobacteria bacterium]NIM73156.1 MerR family transcriptional regulator [Gammaproteobacteria bacterium]NIN38836.1 MerR family transcriptional regulator [Gammaproteobacteria bacterium]NIO24911.1 MerR family transcriptional regulator [Gammaproteobacteria bacterium]NIO65513.1 MerR family transcriptional regulator [Gammaproteobacteria bacterium]